MISFMVDIAVQNAFTGRVSVAVRKPTVRAGYDDLNGMQKPGKNRWPKVTRKKMTEERPILKSEMPVAK